MASSPNVDGTVDLRSHAILQDVTFNRGDCIPGAAIAAVMNNSFMIKQVKIFGEFRPDVVLSTADSRLL